MGRSHRGDQDTANVEPLQQGVRYPVHGRSDNDAVELPDGRWNREAVAKHDFDVEAVEFLQALAGDVGQRSETLDGQHLSRQARQDRGLVAGAGADLEHAMLLLQLELLGHVGDDEGLADGLSTRYRHRAVAIGFRPIGRLDEVLPRHLLQRAQHGLIADAPPTQGKLKQHFLRGRAGHRGLIARLEAQASIPAPAVVCLLEDTSALLAPQGTVAKLLLLVQLRIRGLHHNAAASFGSAARGGLPIFSTPRVPGPAISPIRSVHRAPPAFPGAPAPDTVPELEPSLTCAACCVADPIACQRQRGHTKAISCSVVDVAPYPVICELHAWHGQGLT
jgi:hypothetical protein